MGKIHKLWSVINAQKSMRQWKLSDRKLKRVFSSLIIFYGSVKVLGNILTSWLSRLLSKENVQLLLSCGRKENLTRKLKWVWKWNVQHVPKDLLYVSISSCSFLYSQSWLIYFFICFDNQSLRNLIRKLKWVWKWNFQFQVVPMLSFLNSFRFFNLLWQSQVSRTD